MLFYQLERCVILEDYSAYIYHAFLRISRYLARTRHNSGLRPGEFGVLWLIEQSEEKALHPSTISRRMGIARPSLTPMLRELESRGLVRCRTDGSDGRKYLVEMTENCQEFRFGQRNRHMQLFDKLICNLDLKELDSLTQILHKIEESLQTELEKQEDIIL